MAYSIAAGIVIVEWLVRATTRMKISLRLTRLQVALRAFRAAEDDEARQSLILKAGMQTLTVSLLLLATLLIACLVMVLPWAWFPVTEFELGSYMLCLSVTAAMWWRFRYAGG